MAGPSQRRRGLLDRARAPGGLVLSSPSTPEVLAVVPARGGSKGLPRKNLAPFLGRPLIEWSIRAGLEAETVARTIVTTDDEEIADAARRAGAEVPFLRPAELAQDHVLDLPVFQHVVAWFDEHEGYRPDVVVQLRPTSPVRPPGLVDRAVRSLLDAPDADSVRAVCVSPCNPYKMWRVEDGHLAPLLESDVPEHWNAPRQALPVVHWQTGTIDVMRRRTLVDLDSMSGTTILPLEVDAVLAGDIDDQLSLEWTEQLARRAGMVPHEP
ncbi:MAG: acylneuraminate cytidylyltransferase family protein [Acidimicrobiales bacterium]